MKHEDLANGPTAVASDVASGGRSSSKSAVLSPGDHAGDYKIVRHLGGGAMGDVYEGVHEEIDKRVAVKVIKHVLADSDEAAERFKREARAVNKIDHPNVLDVFAFGRLSDGRFYLAMDLLEGESLGARLRDRGALDLDRFVEVFTPICSALAAAHEQGIVHRDLKPDNVFLARVPPPGKPGATPVIGWGDPRTSRSVDDEERVYVLDFGIAKILSDVANETGRGTLTGEGVWMGTPAYMAPEQWTSEGSSPRSDIYALGAMAYEMLSGTVPYKAMSVPAIMEKHFHEEVPHLDTGGGRQPLPEGLDVAVRTAMAKKPEARFESADQFVQAVREAIAGVSRPHGKASAAAAPTARGGLERRRPVPMWAAAVALLVVAVGIALVVVMQRNESKPEIAEDQTESKADLAVGEIGLDLASAPRGARVEIGGVEVGEAPLRYKCKRGDALEITMTKPGYVPASASIVVDEPETVRLELAPVSGFDGVWQLPDGRFREFRRDGHRVLAWKLGSASGDSKTELGTFEFVPSDPGWISFARTTEAVDERNPEHKSCRRRLGAEYRYHVVDRRMETRVQLDEVSFDGTLCTVEQTWWSEYQSLRRPETASTDLAVVTESTAGAGRVRDKSRKRQRKKRPPNDQTAGAVDVGAIEPEPPQQVKDELPLPNQAANRDPAPVENAQQGSANPAQRQTGRAPAQKRNVKK